MADRCQLAESNGIDKLRIRKPAAIHNEIDVEKYKENVSAPKYDCTDLQEQ